MPLPYADHAIIPPDKIVAYLLNEANPRARGKAAFFLSFGFTTAQPEVLAAALLAHAQTQSVISSRPAMTAPTTPLKALYARRTGETRLSFQFGSSARRKLFLAWSRLIAHSIRMLKEHESVVLTSDVPEHGLKAGDLGVIVYCHDKNEAFEVEFMTLAGKTVAVVTLLGAQVRAIGLRDLPQVRELSVA